MCCFCLFVSFRHLVIRVTIRMFYTTYVWNVFAWSLHGACKKIRQSTSPPPICMTMSRCDFIFRAIVFNLKRVSAKNEDCCCIYDANSKQYVKQTKNNWKYEKRHTQKKRVHNNRKKIRLVDCHVSDNTSSFIALTFSSLDLSTSLSLCHCLHYTLLP